MLAHMAWEPDNDTATRLKILRHYAGCGGWGGQTTFAARYGFETKVWNNYERGSTLPTPAAIQLVQKFPGLTLDWLHLGKWDGVPGRLRAELEAAEKAMTDPEEDTSRKA